MAAVALPNIAGFVRQAKVRGAMQQVVGEIQTARNKAIVKNVSPGQRGGVVFAILDGNTYRFSVTDEDYREDPPNLTLGVAPLRDLPQGVTFVRGSATPVFAIGFDNLGRRCAIDPTMPPCAPIPQSVASMCPEADVRCTDRPTGSYLDAAGSDIRVRVREDATQIIRTILITPGGKVTGQR